MESVLAQGDGKIERYAKDKKAKKIQKKLARQSMGVNSPPNKMHSVRTDPLESFNDTPDSKKGHQTANKKGKTVMFDACDCNDKEVPQNFKKKYQPKTWDSISKFYGDHDTTEVWIDSENRSAKVNNLKYKKSSLENERKVKDIGDVKKRNNSISKKRHRKQHSKKENMLNGGDQYSLISLFKNKNNNDEKLHGKQILKNNNRKPSADSKQNSTKIKCLEGPCTEAMLNENKTFICKCNGRKNIVAKECTNDTCKLSRTSSSINSIINMRAKILEMCRKYSQKILNLRSNKDPCDKGLCNKAIKQKRYDFNCKCVKNNVFNECSDETCGEYKVIQLEHEGEQTGEPFFEVKVNPRDMCVLNPQEIKDNIIKYGKRGKYEFKCICPSRGRLRKGDICDSGTCKKAYKNKYTNFKCWCEKKLGECGDSTCDVHPSKNYRNGRKNFNQSINQNRNKPLLEVQLDVDKMCVINPEEIEDKMINNLTVDEMCSSGACRDAILKKKAPLLCKCISNKMNPEFTECTEDTCVNPSKRRSKFCSLFTRTCSKSENWSPHRNSNKRLKRRSFYEFNGKKLCRGKICSKSDNLQRHKDLFTNGEKHLPICDCKECKDIKKSEPLKERYNNRQDKISNLKTLRKNNVEKDDVDKIYFIPKNETKNSKPPTTKIKKSENTTITEEVQKKEDITCTCAHRCECDLFDEKLEMKLLKTKDKIGRDKLAQKLRDKKISRRQYLKELKRRAKIERKNQKEAEKLRQREIRMIQQKLKEEPLDTNFCTACFLGFLKICVHTVFFVLYLIFIIIKDPKGCFWYVRDRMMDPEGTYKKVRKWFTDAILIKKLQISQTIRGSDTLSILADHFLDSELYQAVADKGHTKNEQMEFDHRSKARKRRIRKREQQAITSCRHTLLTTLRKTPCLWVYHICPNFYPQCLSLLAFMRNFSHILMFLVAFACWTPCIVSFELCRAMLCCFMCTN